MTLAKQVRWIAGWGTVGMLLVASVGCGQKHSRLADRTAEMPGGVEFPEGFSLLKGHADMSEADQIDGWPRYIVSERDDMIMVYVPTMTFMMGGGTDVNEVPAREVVVNHFYIDLCEVTNAQFVRFYKCAGARHLKVAQRDCFKDYWSPGFNDGHPVRSVSWYEARKYAKWTGKRLPTEAEWEAAARGNDRRIYPWGNDEVSEVTRYLCNARTGLDNFDGYEFTAPVMNFAAGVSPVGAFNMAGNVWEWCEDNYDPGRYAYPSDADPATGLERGLVSFGDVNYPNPLQKRIPESRVGPLMGDERVIRGGSFANPVEDCRVDSRASARPDAHIHNVGFRCILPLPPQSAM